MLGHTYPARLMHHHTPVRPLRFDRSDAPGGRRCSPLTSIAIGLHAISVLQSVTPGALVPGRCVQALPDSVPALEPVSPLSPVHPSPLAFYAESVAFPLRPVALVQVPAGPGVDADHLESVGPGARVLTLALGSGAHTLAVGFAVLPASAVGATIVKVEPTARHSETEGRGSQRRCEERTASDGGRAHQQLRRLLRAGRGRVRGGRHGCQSRSTAEGWNTRQP
ncbi:hypothetical protein F7725_012136 [Dissostichus mawsoni]|uniref:Uncharacterized protein n=1 Tax=Dissostichus mawsoni TaxID=36200 RepID=A0A7J5ZAX3_DISMA|nr:hypothetical protein F7725_012136 [Dissostichus mawsoni]